MAAPTSPDIASGSALCLVDTSPIGAHTIDDVDVAGSVVDVSVVSVVCAVGAVEVVGCDVPTDVSTVAEVVGAAEETVVRLVAGELFGGAAA